MKASSYYSHADRCDIVTLEVGERDKANAVNSREIINEVRRLIAQEIAARIMLKLGPVIDAALSQVGEPVK